MSGVKSKRLSKAQTMNWLSDHKAQLEYAYQYLDGRMTTTNISILLNETGEEIGFIDSRFVQSSDFSAHDDAEFIVKNLNENERYFFIDTLNLREPCHKKGYGTNLVNFLKERIKEPILVYVTADSYDFWYNQGFQPVEGDDYWLSYQEVASQLAIA